MSFTAGFTCSELPNRLLYTSWALCLNSGLSSPTIVHSRRKFCVFNQRALPWSSFKVNTIHRWPNRTPKTLALMHTLKQTQCESTYEWTLCPYIGRSSTSLLYFSFSRFTVTGQRLGVRGRGSALPTKMQVHYSAPVSCSARTSTPSLN